MDTINSFKGYGKVDELEHRVFRRNTRKRLLILIVSAIVLVAVIIAAVTGTVIHNRNAAASDEIVVSHISAIDVARQLVDASHWSEKDEYFKILKEGSEGPIVVSVEGRQLKNASFDKKFTALDHHMKARYRIDKGWLSKFIEELSFYMMQMNRRIVVISVVDLRFERVVNQGLQALKISHHLLNRLYHLKNSQQKILTVKSEHLAEVRGKSSAISLGGDDAESGKPFDLLGTQDGSTYWMWGAGTSADGGYGVLDPSTERSSWVSNGVVL
ncbi:hypothetical protein U1Q18_033682 [Sarracenia purpurea var. burkii]